MNIEDIIIKKTAKSVQVTFPGFIVGNTDVIGRLTFFSELDCAGEVVNIIDQPIPESLQSKRIAEIVVWLFEQNKVTLA